jgi:hypothetical protein
MARQGEARHGEARLGEARQGKDNKLNLKENKCIPNPEKQSISRI